MSLPFFQNSFLITSLLQNNEKCSLGSLPSSSVQLLCLTHLKVMSCEFLATLQFINLRSLISFTGLNQANFERPYSSSLISKKLTVCKKCAKPQREAKMQSATDPLIPLGGGVLEQPRGGGRGHQARPRGKATEARPPGEATRRGHKARPRREAAPLTLETQHREAAPSSFAPLSHLNGNSFG